MRMGWLRIRLGVVCGAALLLAGLVFGGAAADSGLLYGYMSQVAEEYSGQAADSSLEARGVAVQLTGMARTLYDAYLPFVRKVAAGEEESAVHQMEFPDGNGLWISLAELGLSGDPENSAVNEALVQYLYAEIQKAIRMLLTNCPYELYWYDKTDSIWLYKKYEYDRANQEVRLTQLDTYFSIAGDYRSASDSNRTDTGKIQAAVRAAQNAGKLVRRYAALGDYDKLDAYRQEICELTCYNYDAWQDGGAAMPYGDPWQLVWVFDGDPETNVVCEGYSKAFQFLCDLSEFAGDVHCFTVSGTMGWQEGGDYGAEAHMWNTVCMDGVVYLTDITSCDDSSGYPDRLFMTGATESGVTWAPAENVRYTGCYRIGFDGWDLYYCYGAATTGQIDPEELTLTAAEQPDSSDCIWDQHWAWRITPGGTLLLDDLSGLYEEAGMEPGNEPLSAAPWKAVQGEITRVVLSARVTEIPEGLLDGLEAVRAVDVTAQHPLWTSEDGVLYTKGMETLLLCPVGKTGAVTVPDGVGGIAAGAFAGCGVTAVTISGDVRSVGDGAFRGCGKMEEVIFNLEDPEAEIAFGTDVFSGAGSGLILYCYKCTAPERAFSGEYAIRFLDGKDPEALRAKVARAVADQSMSCLVLPADLEIIEAGAFENLRCEVVILPDGCTEIEGLAFANNERLFYVFIPESVTRIAENAFDGCDAVILDRCGE